MPNYEIEYELTSKCYQHIVGVDECSRGSLIGSVYAGAVILNRTMVNVFSTLLDDSKKLSPTKRHDLSYIVKATCTWAIGEASAEEIDKLNILNATQLAMYRAVEKLPHVDYILIDGNMKFDDMFDNYESIVKGDAKCLSISAASIVAKEYQCNIMLELDKQYPGYDLAHCKGYGTKKHKEAIAKLGPCPLHRKTFGGVKEYC